MDKRFIESEIGKAKEHMLLAEQSIKTISQIVQAEPPEDPAAGSAAPQKRSCPHCGRLIMEVAITCGYCWKRVRPATSEPPTS
jgi:hypothetical protein